MNKYQITLLFVSLLAMLSCSEYTSQLSVVHEQPVLPVLTLKEINPVSKFTITRSDNTVYIITQITVSLDGTTDLNDIQHVSLYMAGEKGMPDKEKQIGKSLSPESLIIFTDDFQVDADTTTFWITVRLKDKVDLRHRINATIKSISTSLGSIDTRNITNARGQRTGVALRQHQQDGVHTSRIPGLATTRKGTLIAIYDARWDKSRDLQGDIDIALNRSTDGGLTWQPMQIALDMGEWGGLPGNYNGVSDACILVDENSNDIYIAGLWMYGVLDGETGKWVPEMTADSTRWIHQWRARGSQPGFGVKETSQFLITKSSDDGLTWSEPLNITATTKRKEWWLYAPAPGHGITLSDGTLVFPTQGRDKNGHPFSNITYSKDGGKSWVASNPAFSNTTECMAVQLSDGSVMLNMRYNLNRNNTEENGRIIAVTSDLGETWSQHPTSRKALIEPTCMASIHKHIRKGKSLLLFVNPASHSRRDHITLKASFDDGNTWPKSHILLDEYSGRGYSCITSVNDSVIGVVYESSQADMVYQQVEIKEIVAGHW